MRKKRASKPYRFRLDAFLDDVYWAIAQFNVMKQPNGFAWYLGKNSQTDHELVIRLLRRHKAKPLSWLCEQAAFSDLVHDTLRSWGMGKRGSKMVGLRKFEGRVENLVASPAFRRVAQRQIHEVKESKSWRVDLQALWDEVTGPSRIVMTRSRFVGSTKLLHHLVPDLVPPMDREYTLRFLSALDKTDPPSRAFRVTAGDKRGKEFGVFYKGMQLAAHVARKRTGIADFLDRGPMSGSVPKLIDNAIIAWWQSK